MHRSQSRVRALVARVPLLILSGMNTPGMQQFPFMTDRLSMTYENGERSGPIDPLFAPEGASYRLSNDRMRYDQQAQGAMET